MQTESRPLGKWPGKTLGTGETRHNVPIYTNIIKMTFISRMEASVSTDMEVSQLPLREKPPPSEAKVAAERVDAVLDP